MFTTKTKQRQMGGEKLNVTAKHFKTSEKGKEKCTTAYSAFIKETFQRVTTRIQEWII